MTKLNLMTLVALGLALVALPDYAFAAPPPEWGEDCKCWETSEARKAEARAKRSRWARAKRNACGNGKVDERFREQCDPNGDPLCAQDCKCTDGSSPNARGKCESTCGDGRRALDEMCEGGAYCNSSCACPDGMVPDWASRGCVSVCGDGKLAAGEECDSKDADAHCVVSTCQCQTGFEPDGKGKCTPRCGNGTLDPEELCDSGIKDSHCLSTCQNCEPGFEPHPDEKGKCRATCGNGRHDNGESCDFNLDSANCTLRCGCKDGWEADPNNAGHCRQECDPDQVRADDSTCKDLPSVMLFGANIELGPASMAFGGPLNDDPFQIGFGAGGYFLHRDLRIGGVVTAGLGPAWLPNLDASVFLYIKAMFLWTPIDKIALLTGGEVDFHDINGVMRPNGWWAFELQWRPWPRAGSFDAFFGHAVAFPLDQGEEYHNYVYGVPRVDFFKFVMRIGDHPDSD